MGTAAWFSLGVFALTPHSSNSSAVGVLPPIWLWAVLAVVGTVVTIRFRHISPALALLPSLTILPWIGVRLAPALIWSGPFVGLLWLLVVTGGIPFKWTISRTYRAVVLTAATLALFEVVASGNLVTGDEPHYLLIARSLQRDADLDLANDYDVSRHRDFYPGPLTPRHTILTGLGREYSFHGLGVALLAFPGFVAAGVAGARLVFIIISALGVAATWKAARDLTDRNSAGTIAVVFLLCQLSFVAQGAAIYPDGPAAAITAGALLTLLRVDKSRPSAAWLYSCGAALTFLPWLHIRLTPVAIVFAVALVIAMRRRSHAPASYVALFAVPLVGAALFFASAYVMFETLDSTAPFRTKAAGSLAAVPSGVFGLLADVEYGLLPYAPAAVFALAGVRRFVAIAPIAALASSAALLSTLLISGAFVWWGGTTSPARFLVPVLPLIAVSIGVWWTTAQPVPRALCVALLALGGLLTAAAAYADRGAYVVTDPDGRFTVFEWLNRLVILPDALPSLFRDGAMMRTEVLIAAAWAGSALAILWLIQRLAYLVTDTSVRLSTTISAFAIAVWITVGCTAGWALGSIRPVTPDRAQLALLHASAMPWLTTGWRNVLPVGSTDELLASLAFMAPSTRDSDTLLHVPFPPPGRYQIELDPAPASMPSNARLLVIIGRTEVPIVEWSPSANSNGPIFMTVMPVHSIHVRADPPDPSSNLRARLRVLGVRNSLVPRGLFAEQMVRSGDVFVYLLDSAAAIDHGGFWLTGERTTRVVLASPDGAVGQATLEFEATDIVRVTLTRGAWQHHFSINPGERTTTRLPSSADSEILAIHVSAEDRRRPILFVSARSEAP
jgi:hypothetical protein